MQERKSITDLINDLKQFRYKDKVNLPDTDTLILYSDIDSLINKLQREKENRKRKIDESGVYVPDNEI
jgi:hypothetical protein